MTAFFTTVPVFTCRKCQLPHVATCFNYLIVHFIWFLCAIVMTLQFFYNENDSSLGFLKIVGLWFCLSIFVPFFIKLKKSTKPKINNRIIIFVFSLAALSIFTSVATKLFQGRTCLGQFFYPHLSQFCWGRQTICYSLKENPMEFIGDILFQCLIGVLLIISTHYLIKKNNGN